MQTNQWTNPLFFPPPPPLCWFAKKKLSYYQFILNSFGILLKCITDLVLPISYITLPQSVIYTLHITLPQSLIYTLHITLPQSPPLLCAVSAGLNKCIIPPFILQVRVELYFAVQCSEVQCSAVYWGIAYPCHLGHPVVREVIQSIYWD